MISARSTPYNVTLLYVLLLTATLLHIPFGVAAGDELVPPADDGTSRPVSLSCQFYGVEEDTVYVRNNLYYHKTCSIIHIICRSVQVEFFLLDLMIHVLSHYQQVIY